MKQKPIYLVQVDALRKLPTHYTVYLPYSVGALWAYAKQSATVNENFSLEDMFFMRDNVNEVVARMDEPFLVGFSCYVWSTEYNKVLAQAVKKAYPHCYILFGGHNVPPAEQMLEELPYVDFLIHDEGEIPFQALLTQLAQDDPDFTDVPGLSYRTPQGNKTNPVAVADSVEDFPSPYLEGLFDDIINKYDYIQWSAVWETNRGCPHHCAYCDWGQKRAKVRLFSRERLLAEIEWMNSHNVGFVYGADANFGIFSRDEELLDVMIENKKRTGLPRMFDVNTTKIFNERTFRIAEKLYKSDMDKIGASLSLQSLSSEVLKNIGRVNIGDEVIANWIKRCRQAGVRSHTDLIIGLPGETLESFCAGIEKLLALGQHEGIRFFPCNLIPNAPMAKDEFIKKHNITTRNMVFKTTMQATPDLVDEYVDVIDSTSTMSRAEILTVIFFMQIVHGAHSFGLLRLIAIFCHTQKFISYGQFYLKLIDYGKQSLLLGDIQSRIIDYLGEIRDGKEAHPLQIEGFSFGRMVEEQYYICRAIMELDKFYAEVKAFLGEFEIDPHLLEQLIHYQRESIMLPNSTEKVLEFDYDFPAYFNAIYDGEPIPLEKRRVKLRFSLGDGVKPEDIATPQKYFHSIVQLGRFTSKAFYKIEEII
ncbi:MAG: radical SAM protein [Oscillospiraceae bacterium]|nr:radical SAM protein [Oscillospiraceae bacterium]